MIGWIVVRDDGAKFFARVGKDIIQNLVKAIAHSLQYSGFNINMLRQHTYYALVNGVNVFLIKHINSHIVV